MRYMQSDILFHWQSWDMQNLILLKLLLNF